MGGRIPLRQQLRHRPERLVAWWDEAVWVVHPLRGDGTINTCEAYVYDRMDEKLLAKMLLDEGIFQVQCPSKHLVNVRSHEVDRAQFLTEDPEEHYTFFCLECDPPIPVFGFAGGELKFNIQSSEGMRKRKAKDC